MESHFFKISRWPEYTKYNASDTPGEPLAGWAFFKAGAVYEFRRAGRKPVRTSHGSEFYAQALDVGRVAGGRNNPWRDVVVHPRARSLRCGVNAHELSRARQFAGLRPFRASRIPGPA